MKVQLTKDLRILRAQERVCLCVQTQGLFCIVAVCSPVCVQQLTSEAKVEILLGAEVSTL